MPHCWDMPSQHIAIVKVSIFAAGQWGKCDTQKMPVTGRRTLTVPILSRSLGFCFLWYHHEQLGWSASGSRKMEGYFLAENALTCTEGKQTFQSGALPLLKRVAGFWEEKKIWFWLKFAQVMDFFDYHIHFCLFTAEPEVLILEAVSKFT